jgi:hypothetical protein
LIKKKKKVNPKKKIESSNKNLMIQEYVDYVADSKKKPNSPIRSDRICTLEPNSHKVQMTQYTSHDFE